MIKPSAAAFSNNRHPVTESTIKLERDANIRRAKNAPVTIQKIDIHRIMSEAIASYNTANKRLIERERKEPLEACSVGSINSRVARSMLRTIRHDYSNYDVLWRSFAGKPGAHDAWQIIKCRILSQTATTYPELKVHANYEIQNTHRQEKEEISRSSALINALAPEYRQTARSALDEEVEVSLKPIQQVISETLSSRNHKLATTKLEADFRDPAKRAAMNRAMIEHITRTQTNCDALCLKYRGQPGYEHAWNIIYTTTMSRIASIYPKLQMSVSSMLQSKYRPWTSHKFPMEWTTARGDAVSFDFRVDNPGLSYLVHHANSTGAAKRRVRRNDMLNVCISEYTNFNDISNAIRALDKDCVLATAIDLKVNALRHIADVHPIFTEVVKARIASFDSKAKKPNTTKFQARVLADNRAIVRELASKHPKLPELQRGLSALPRTEQAAEQLRIKRIIHESIRLERPELEEAINNEMSRYEARWQPKVERSKQAA